MHAMFSSFHIAMRFFKERPVTSKRFLIWSSSNAIATPWCFASVLGSHGCWLWSQDYMVWPILWNIALWFPLFRGGCRTCHPLMSEQFEFEWAAHFDLTFRSCGDVFHPVLADFQCSIFQQHHVVPQIGRLISRILTFGPCGVWISSQMSQSIYTSLGAVTHGQALSRGSEPALNRVLVSELRQVRHAELVNNQMVEQNHSVDDNTMNLKETWRNLTCSYTLIWGPGPHPWRKRGPRCHFRPFVELIFPHETDLKHVRDLQRSPHAWDSGFVMKEPPVRCWETPKWCQINLWSMAWRIAMKYGLENCRNGCVSQRELRCRRTIWNQNPKMAWKCWWCVPAFVEMWKSVCMCVLSPGHCWLLGGAADPADDKQQQGKRPHQKKQVGKTVTASGHPNS